MRNIIKTRFLFTVWLCLIVTGAFGQYDIASFQAVQKEYPEENIIKLIKKLRITIDIKNNKPDIHIENNEQILYLKNVRNIDPEQSAYTSTFNELVEFEAYSHVLKKKKYKKIPVKTYDVVKKYESGVFYDDYKELVFTFPGIAEGSVIELNTLHKIHEPRFLGSYFLNEFYPVREFEMVIDCPEDMSIDLIQQNMPGKALKIYKTVKKGRKIVSVNLDKLERYRYEEFQPDRRFFVPHVIPIIRSYTINGIKIPVLESCDDLYAWYYSFIADLDKGVDYFALKQITDSLTDDSMPEIDRVGILYNWVQQNIKYIAFEDGLGGLVPRKADEVLLKRYGDCKDKSNLLHALLKEAGITSYLTWIGTRELPYKYSELCSPVVDNHMIVTYIHKGDCYFLDPTGSYLTMDIPTSFIQGKDALIAIDSQRYEIRQVPVVHAEKNQISDTVWLELEGVALTGKGKLTMTGLPRINFQYLTDMDDLKEKKSVIEEITQKGSNKFVLNSYSLAPQKKLSDTCSLQYEFRIDGYARLTGDEIYLNINLDRYWLEYKLDKDRQSPFEIENTMMKINTFVLKIPDGYRIKHLPEGSSYHSDDISCKLEYRKEENKIIYSMNVRMNKVLFENDELQDWRGFISFFENINKETIIIIKNHEV